MPLIFALIFGSLLPNSLAAAFNASIGGRMHAERPVGASCYLSDPLYNPNTCANATANYGGDQWRSDYFSAYQNIEWEPCGTQDSCLLPPPNNKSAICGQGVIPNYAVNASTAEDIHKYLQFAIKYDLSIVIKNTGHDFKGRSSGKGAFALWTHNLQEISRNARFVPKGCKIPAQDSITTGAGVQWGTAFQYASDLGLVIVGGHCDGVGTAGGWLMGGGHSILTPSYGLGVDNLLEASIITADGQLQTISECSNPDLFWAIRGGGPSYGVITSVTYKVRKDSTMNSVFITTNTSTSAALESTFEIFTSISPNLNKLGIGGFLEIFTSKIDYIGVLPGGNMPTLKTALKPVTDTLPASAINFTTFSGFLPFQNYISTGSYAYFVGTPIVDASRLIPSSYMENDPAGLVKAVRKAQAEVFNAGATFAQVNMVTPPSSFNTGKTSVTPVFYSSPWHLSFQGTWAVNASTSAQKEVVELLHKGTNILRAYAPDGGAYQNECEIFEPNYEESFWGANAARLKTIKKKVDPQNVFQVWQGVGWQGENDPKYSCYNSLNPGIQLD